MLSKILTAFLFCFYFLCLSFACSLCLAHNNSPEGKDVSTSSAGGGNNNNNGNSGGSGPGSGATGADNSTNQPKWPIKPGVHLHVNGLHSLGKSVKPINGFSYGTKHSTSTLPNISSSTILASPMDNGKDT